MNGFNKASIILGTVSRCIKRMEDCLDCEDVRYRKEMKSGVAKRFTCSSICGASVMCTHKLYMHWHIPTISPELKTCNQIGYILLID